jgi:hypothetical protein
MIIRTLNIILASVLAFILASPVQAERAFYSAFSLVPNATALGDLVLTQTNSLIRTDTADGADAKAIIINGGGRNSRGAGANIVLHGNETGFTGNLSLQSGNAAGADISIDAVDQSEFRSNGNLLWSIPTTGAFTQDATNGGDIVFNRAGTSIRTGTADAADSAVLQIAGGGGVANTRGATITLDGNEAGVPGSIRIDTGAIAASAILNRLNNASSTWDVRNLSGVLWSISAADGNLTQNVTNGGNIVLNRVTTDITRTREVVTAAGTTQGTAAAITGHFIQANGASGTNGVILPTSVLGRTRTIFNNSASVLLLYPAVGGVINANATNASVSIAAYALAYVMEVGSGQYFISEAPAA